LPANSPDLNADDYTRSGNSAARGVSKLMVDEIQQDMFSVRADG